MTDQLRRTPIETDAAGLAVIDDRHVVAAYARWAPFYDWSFGVFTAGPRRAVMNVVNGLPPGRVLELGVGTGISLPDYDRGHRVVGVDLSPEMLDRARRRVTDDKLAHVESLHEMDAGKLTFADGSFDTAVAMFVITVVPDPDRVLAEMVRIVRPGGASFSPTIFRSTPDRGPRSSAGCRNIRPGSAGGRISRSSESSATRKCASSSAGR